jgi:hypothetical protein
MEEKWTAIESLLNQGMEMVYALETTTATAYGKWQLDQLALLVAFIEYNSCVFALFSLDFIFAI